VSTTSSSSFELQVRQGGDAQVLTGSLLQPGRKAIFEHEVRTDRSVTLALRCRPRVGSLRVMLGTAVAGVLPASQDASEATITALLAELCGEAILRVELGGDEEVTPLLTARLPLIASPHLEALYEQLLDELMRIHAGLAQDVLGPSLLRGRSAESRLFEPSAEAETLERHHVSLDAALREIGSQPSEALERRRTRTRWRPGDLVDARTVASLAGSPDVSVERGRVTRIDRITARRTIATRDIAEHRHLRSGLLALARRAEALREGCLDAAASFEQEAREWGIRSGSASSVYARRFEPRVRRLREVAVRAGAVSRGFRRLIEEHPYVAEAGTPRTRFGPTPIFLGRPAYRRAFEVLREARRLEGVMVDGLDLAFHVRPLDQLYEYWVFTKVVRTVADRLGAPSDGTGFRVLDEVYRPDLVPGQSFGWTLGKGREIRVWYEPAIPPVRSRTRGPAGLAASLVSAPLRPDVLILELRDGVPVQGTVIDAKSTARFERGRLFEVSDYRTLIHVAATGVQPVRHLFLVHRTAGGEYCSLPGFFEGRAVEASVSMLGAFPLLPGSGERLTGVLDVVLERAMPAVRPFDRTPWQATGS